MDYKALEYFKQGISDMHKAGMSLEEMENESGLARKDIYEVLKYAGLSIVDVGELGSGINRTDHVLENLEEIKKDYYEERMRVRDLANKWGISVPTLYNVWQELELPLRTQVDKGRDNAALNAAIEMYKRGDRVRSIYRETGIYPTKLYEALEERGIPGRQERTRNRGEERGEKERKREREKMSGRGRGRGDRDVE